MNISPSQDFLGRLIEKHPQLFIKLGKIENWWLLEQISETQTLKPVYISGLARSGTTILLEKLNQHPQTASLQYRDFPFIHTPVSWNWFLERASKTNFDKIERAHKDGIFITPESPEAMEEVLWMNFFPQCHQAQESNLLTENTSNSDFESFYHNHLKKILYIRKGKRYLSKGNYNIARLAYINKILPESKFIIPVREPLWHIASLIKQQKLFSEYERKDQRVLDYMRRVGHFEFGLDRRPINFNNNDIINEITTFWDNKEEIKGWAKYWTYIHEYILEVLTSNKELASKILIVPYNNLCEHPYETLNKIYKHCDLEVKENYLNEQASTIKAPGYALPFSKNEISLIIDLCQHAYNKFDDFRL